MMMANIAAEWPDVTRRPCRVLRVITACGAAVIECRTTDRIPGSDFVIGLEFDEPSPAEGSHGFIVFGEGGPRWESPAD
jgi:hypothetical protein